MKTFRPFSPCSCDKHAFIVRVFVLPLKDSSLEDSGRVSEEFTKEFLKGRFACTAAPSSRSSALSMQDACAAELTELLHGQLSCFANENDKMLFLKVAAADGLDTWFACLFVCLIGHWSRLACHVGLIVMRHVSNNCFGTCLKQSMCLAVCHTLGKNTIHG